MKTTTLFLAALLAMTSFIVGIGVGRHLARAPTARSPSGPPDNPPRAGQLPPAFTTQSKRPAQTGDRAENSTRRLSLAEIETALAELKNVPRKDPVD